MEDSKKIVKFEADLENIKQTLSEIKSEIQLQDRALSSKDDVIGRMSERLEHFMVDFNDFKTEMKEMYNTLASHSNKHNVRISRLESEMNDIKEDIDRLDQAHKEHLDTHRYKDNVMSARNWRLWVVIISGTIGIFFAIFKDDILNNKNENINDERIIDEIRTMILEMKGWPNG